ncbi:hypothetical protein STEG23_022079 [Scotinomys teguina]
MGNECFLSFTTSHLPLYTQNLAKYRLQIVEPPTLPLGKKPNPDKDGPDLKPNLWMWVNPNIVYPPCKLEVERLKKKEARLSVLPSCLPAWEEEEASCSKASRAQSSRQPSPPCKLKQKQKQKHTASSPTAWEELTDEEAKDQDDSSSVALPSLPTRAPLQSQRRLQQTVHPEEGLWSRPPLNYFHLIALALRNSPSCGLNVQQIYNFMREHFPYFRTAPEGWKNTIRHNLCFRDSFEKVPVEARKAVRAAQVERYVPEHDRCWCPCCGCEVRKHLSHGNLTVLHGALLEHLASPEHKKATNKFWWENKANAQMKEKFLISPQDYARFKKSMVKGLDSYEEKEDEVIKKMAAQIREAEQSQQEVVRSALEPQAEPDPEEGSSASGSWKVTNGHVASSSEQASHSDLQHVPELDWMETGQHLTFIGHQDTPGVGNIHSGAVPPWMVPEEEHSSGNLNLPIGPSYEEFLKEKEKQKLKKLPPERVGASFDHSSNTSAGWLPSFGRVWNNGRRWQSRRLGKESGAQAGHKVAPVSPTAVFHPPMAAAPEHMEAKPAAALNAAPWTTKSSA